MPRAVLVLFAGLGSTAPGCRESAKREAPPAALTAVPSEATGGDRDVLVELAGLRDRACACSTMDCVEAVHDALDMSTGALGPTAAKALRDAGDVMIDELMGCTHLVREQVTFGGPPGPPSPAAVRAYVDQIRAKRARAE